MISAEIRFGLNKNPVAFMFMRRGQVTLHDTCMIVSGPVQRFHIPLLVFGINGINRIFAELWCSASYRTIPYGAVEKHSGRGGVLRRMHTVVFRLPSGRVVWLMFTVLGGSARRKAFRAALEDNLTATKALFAR